MRVLALVVMVAGCGDSKSNAQTDAPIVRDGPPDAPAIDAPDHTQACTDYAQAACDGLQRCDPAELQLLFGDAATCRTRVDLQCGLQFVTGSSLLPMDMSACASGIATASCTTLAPNQTFSFGAVTTCGAPPGTRADGYVCGPDSECQSGFCNRIGSVLDYCGTCAHRAQIGEDCVATDCAPSLICVATATAATCAAPNTVAATGACSQAAQCMAGLNCVAGACTAILHLNDTCTPSADACDHLTGLYCDTGTTKCVAAAFVAPGGACGAAVPAQRTVCAGSGRCLNNVCAGPALDGERSAVYGCLYPAVATNGVCALPNPGVCQ